MMQSLPLLPVNHMISKPQIAEEGNNYVAY